VDAGGIVRYRLVSALIVLALPVLVAAFVRFVREGVGTPAPVAPTEHLVVGGLYRYVRNPCTSR
jgi:protein-S-isoprenylcysteine O-methyltransferase Ste14